MAGKSTVACFKCAYSSMAFVVVAVCCVSLSSLARADTRRGEVPVKTSAGYRGSKPQRSIVRSRKSVRASM